MPTWTNASDLNLAVYSGHGEFPRCVIAASDSASAYTSIQKGFNLAEKYQIPVVVLTDKLIAESLFQVDDLEKDITIERHLVDEHLLKSLKPVDRFKLSKSGISPRWLPGQSDACYVGNSDEHLEDGTVTEEAIPGLAMNLKRLVKIQTLLGELPEPELIGPKESLATFVGWGSVKNAICDVVNLWNKKFPKKVINYLHYEFVYPVRTDKLKELILEKQLLILVESNSFGQLGALLTQNTGYKFEEKLLKFDGRPFFVEDIIDYLTRRSWD